MSQNAELIEYLKSSLAHETLRTEIAKADARRFGIFCFIFGTVLILAITGFSASTYLMAQEQTRQIQLLVSGGIETTETKETQKVNVAQEITGDGNNSPAITQTIGK